MSSKERKVEIKKKIIEFLINAVNYLIEKGYELKFKNISKIIDEAYEAIKQTIEINNKDCTITINIKMFIDPIHTFSGEFIFDAYNDGSEVSYFKMEKNDFDFEIKKQESLVGTGHISFDIYYDSASKKILPISQFRFIENLELLDDRTLYFDIPLKFKVIRYLI